MTLSLRWILNQWRGCNVETKIVYVTISADTKNVEAKAMIDKIRELLQDGWTILTAVGVSGGAHYILSKTVPKVKKPTMTDIEQCQTCKDKGTTNCLAHRSIGA